MIPDPKREERLSPRQSHGLHVLKRARSTLGRRTIDKRTTVGKNLTAWSTALAADLGGVDQLSTQQRTLVDEAVKLKLILGAVDAWVLQQLSLVDRRKRALLPVVRERLALVAQLQSLLRDLGLDRKAHDVPTLDAYLATRQLTPRAESPQERRPTGSEGIAPTGTDDSAQPGTEAGL